jgi:hypothetical protein
LAHQLWIGPHAIIQVSSGFLGGIVDNHLTGEAVELFDADFRRKAAAAIGEFEEALGAIRADRSPAEKRMMREAARDLMKIVARVLVRSE